MSTQPFPMLASPADFRLLRFPVMGFPKIDGIRAVIHEGKPLSRKLIVLPNQFIQGFFSNGFWDGLDGELVVGAANDHLCIKHTTSGVMSHTGEPDFTFYVFDKWSLQAGYEARRNAAIDQCREHPHRRIVPLMGKVLHSIEEVDAYEAQQLEQGFEGIILRSIDAPYKHGRSTAREGGMLKVKRFEDSEAEVLGVVEEMHNGNEATKDNLGRTKRSSAKDQKTGKGRMGALRVRDLKTRAEFEIGTGFTAEDRAQMWKDPTLVGMLVKYKFFSVGMQDKPRHPVYIGMRAPIDL